MLGILLKMSLHFNIQNLVKLFILSHWYSPQGEYQVHTVT